MLPKKLENTLLKIQKPGRYTGGELNSVIKNKSKIDIRYAFCFPDTYEIGMSHLGMKILYGLMNEREDTWCERVFAPWNDMEQLMRQEKVKLYGLESGDAICGFDIVGFTLQYELSYTNILNMLDLAGIPLKSADRAELSPIVIAGGPCACNAEPIFDYFDIILPGEGENISHILVDLLKNHKKKKSTKLEFLKEAAKIDGVYVPSFYDVEYNADGTVKKIINQNGAPETVTKSIVSDLDSVYYPKDFVVPSIEVVHDRTTVEVFRGCTRGCRFCQAGLLYRPIRGKKADTVEKQCRSICETTGYDEISLCSLSTSDYTELNKLLKNMADWANEEKINISLPSLRIDTIDSELLEKLASVRRSSLTFAPEAGTQRLRDAINKNLTEEEILSAARTAFAGGWTAVKLYFMIGLPTETDEDIIGIADIAQKIVDEYYKNPEKPKGKGVTVSISLATFVPKPFTPFQWEAQDSETEIYRKQRLLLDTIRTKKITVSRHDSKMSYLEAVFARGDRRLSEVIEAAWKKGCTFDSWDDRFSYDKWLEAFEESGLSPEFYANRKRNIDEVLPWSHMDYGINEIYLKNENKRAYESITTPCCTEKCSGCGANRLNGGRCDAIG